MDTVSSLYINVFEDNPNLESHMTIIEQSMNDAILKKFKTHNLNLRSAFDIYLIQLNENKDWIEIIAEIEVQAFGFTVAKGILSIKRMTNQSKWECLMQNLDQIVSAVCDLVQQLVGRERGPKGFPNKLYE